MGESTTTAYRRLACYVLSGTGNTRRVANWMAEEARARGMDADVFSIEKRTPRPQVAPATDTLVGLLTPTHGFSAPWLAIQFALHMPRAQGTPAFAIATRAGLKFGPVFVPGFEGTAAYLLAGILVCKGYRIRGALGIDMPSNWIALHPGLSVASSLAIGERAQRCGLQFLDRLLRGERQFGNPLILLVGLLLSPVSVMYLLGGRFFLAKTFFANQRCNGCGICAEHCPAKAVRLFGKSRRPYWTFACESCMRCMGYCPPQAIESGHSWAVALYYIMTFPFAMYALNWVSGHIPWVAEVDTPLVRVLLQYPLVLISIAIAYAGFNLLTRIPLFNYLFTYTTLTHFYRRYHEPETKLKDLQ